MFKKDYFKNILNETLKLNFINIFKLINLFFIIFFIQERLTLICKYKDIYYKYKMDKIKNNTQINKLNTLIE